MKTALALLFVLSGVPAAFAQSKVFDKTVPLAASGSITLTAHNGSIDIRTWQRPEVQIHAQIDAASSWAQDVRRFNDTSVSVTTTADTVTVSTVEPDVASFVSWFGSSPNVRYTITAPATARWTVHSHNAQADVRDVRAAFEIDTHNGDLRIQNLAGPLTVTAHNGRTMADFQSFEGARIDVHNGSADLTLPRDSRFDLRMASHNGQLRSDFPMVSRTSNVRGSNVDAAANGGGAPLRFESHNGELRLRAK